MLHDLKHAYRMLMQSKGWTLVVLLSLAIGIGATHGAVHGGQWAAAADRAGSRSALAGRS